MFLLVPCQRKLKEHFIGNSNSFILPLVSCRMVAFCVLLVMLHRCRDETERSEASPFLSYRIITKSETHKISSGDLLLRVQTGILSQVGCHVVCLFLFRPLFPTFFRRTKRCQTGRDLHPDMSHLPSHSFSCQCLPAVRRGVRQRPKSKTGVI